ncbi:MAG TPA: helix-turn-helix transcriptional regulator, partial [Acidimicrobiales bacterium]
DRDRAGRCAFWLGFGLLLRGEEARGGGWLARAERLAEDVRAGGGESVARGLLLVPVAMFAMEEGDTARAAATADEIVDLGRRHDDLDVLTLGLLCRGEAMVRQGDVAPGLKALDEAMVAVTTGEVSPVPAGIVYCAVIAACVAVFDLRRAAEWTGALHDWCAAQPDLVPYRGQSLVHRSQVLQAHGEWAEALAEAERARRHLSEPPHPAVGMALYQQGELHRLRGELAAAEEAYRAASRHGMEPVPGFALLRLAEGNVDAAATAARRMVDEGRGRPEHPTVLAAAVEVLVAAGDVDGARAAAGELDALATRLDAALPRAMADQAQGVVLLAGGDAAAALGPLRRACEAWRALGMPYECARSQVGVARACRGLGDHDAADLALDAARTVLERLGARPALAELARWERGAAGVGSDAGAGAGTATAEAATATGAGDRVVAGAKAAGLSDRECQVLRLVAAGKTNRAIAEELIVSPHTVARHVQNIFTKLGVSSRAAATAHAYEHGLV